LVEKGVVGHGWDQFNFQAHENAEQIIQKIGSFIGRRANQIRMFKGIKAGDLILVPLPSAIVVGMAKGKEVRDENAPLDTKNQQQVEFPKDAKGCLVTIPRAGLLEALERRLRIRASIADLAAFKDELEKLYTTACRGHIHDYKEEIASKEGDLALSQKAKLLANIRSGRTGLRTGGDGLEMLVQELLACDGYESPRRLAKNMFRSSSADADILTYRPDRLGPAGGQAYLVQVKHHTGTTSDWALTQLNEISRTEQAELFKDHALVLITSGEVLESTKEAAQDKGITVIDGVELVDWIWSSISKLKTETRLALGISIVPQVIG
jgi:predicted Mrr-cat superfamily restriction endonuclease